MTYHPTTTPLAAAKDTHTYTPTPISKLFSTLLGALAVAIEAERDIEHVDVFDMAFSDWLKEAEAAWDQVTNIQYMLNKAPVSRTEDVPLKLLALLINMTMAAETPAELRVAQSLLQRNEPWLQCMDNTATAFRASSMLRQGRLLLSQIASLEQFQPLESDGEFPNATCAA